MGFLEASPPVFIPPIIYFFSDRANKRPLNYDQVPLAQRLRGPIDKPGLMLSGSRLACYGVSPVGLVASGRLCRASLSIRMQFPVPRESLL